MKSAADRGGFPPDRGREVAVAGRSNSGKSSAINCLLGSTKLARVSKTPGRTQLINFFELEPERRLVDLPGYGYAAVPDRVRNEWRTLVDAYFGHRSSLAGLVLTVDVRRGLRDLDGLMLSWAGELGVASLVLLTKADKFGRGKGVAAEREVARELPPDVRTVLFSAVSGQGVAEARAPLEAWLGLEAPLAAGRR